MPLFWGVIVLLIALVGLDVQRAYKDFQNDKSTAKFAMHAILLLVLVVIVLNTVFAALGSEFEVPYFDVYIGRKG